MSRATFLTISTHNEEDSLRFEALESLCNKLFVKIMGFINFVRSVASCELFRVFRRKLENFKPILQRTGKCCDVTQLFRILIISISASHTTAVKEAIFKEITIFFNVTVGSLSQVIEINLLIKQRKISKFSNSYFSGRILQWRKHNSVLYSQPLKSDSYLC